jgi:hypothetical protein
VDITGSPTSPLDEASMTTAVNEILADADVDGDDVDSTAKVQAVVDTYSDILNAADDPNGTLALDETDYALLGLDGLSADSASLLSDVLQGKSVSDIDSAAELDALASTVSRVLDTTGGTAANPALTADELSALGITGVTSNNLNAVLASIDGASPMESLADLQTAVDDGIDDYIAALGEIADYADGTSTTVPDADALDLVGVVDPDGASALSDPLLNAVQDSIDSLSGTDVNNTEKLQSIVDSYDVILDWAETDGGSTAPTSTDYEAVGVDLKSSATNPNGLSLLNDVLAATGKEALDVDTVSELQAITDVVDQLMRQVAGETLSPALTKEDFALIGITDVTDGSNGTLDNLSDVLNALAASQDSGLEINSLEKLQAFTSLPTLTIATISGDNIINALEADQTVALSGTVTNVADGTEVTFELINGSSATVSTETVRVQNGQWRTTLDASSLVDDTYTLTASVQKFGVGYDAQQNVTVDTSAPTVTIVTVAGDNILDASERFTETRTEAIDLATGETATVDTLETSRPRPVINGYAGIDENTELQPGDSLTVEILDANGVAHTASLADISTAVSGFSYDNADGSWTLDLGLNGSADLGAGIYAVEVITTVNTTTTDGNGVQVTTSVDSNALFSGAITIDPFETVATRPVFAGTTDTDTDRVEVVFNGKQYTVDLSNDATGNWSLTLPAADAAVLQHGQSYIAEVFAFDAAGNRSTLDTQTLDVDIAPPGTPTVVSQLTNDNTPEITGTAEKVVSGGTAALDISSDTLEVEFGGQTFTLVNGLTYDTSNKSWTLTASQLGDGTYDVSVSVTAGGVTMTDVSSDELVIDTTATLGTVTMSPDLSGQVTNQQTVDFEGSGAEPGAVIKLDLNGTDVSSQFNEIVVDDNGDWSIVAMPFPDGVHTIRFNAHDAAGNLSDPETFNFTVDTVAPSAPTLSNNIVVEKRDGTTETLDGSGTTPTTGDNTPTISGTAEADSTVTIYTGTTVIATVVADGNGIWNHTFSDPLAESKHTFKITATDAAGNVSGFSGEITLDVADRKAEALDILDTYAKATLPADSPIEPIEDDYAILGIDGVTADNLTAINEAINDLTVAGTNITLSEIQDVVDTELARESVEAILAYAGDTDDFAMGVAPTVSVYEKADITLNPPLGVTATELVTAVNTALASGPITENSLADANGIQAVVDAYSPILESSQSTSNAPGLTANDYEALGLADALGLSETLSDPLLAADVDRASLLDDTLKSKAFTDVDEWVELEAVATTVGRIMNTVDANVTDPDPALTRQELASLGLTGVTDDNLNAVLAEISGLNGTDSADTLAKLQQAVDAGNTVYTNALAKIAGFADDNTATAPTADDYSLAGVELSVSPLSEADMTTAVNGFLADTDVVGTDADTTAEVQAILDTYGSVLNAADSDGTLALAEADYALLGLDGVNADGASLLNSVLPNKTVAELDTAQKLNDLTDVAMKVLATADNTNPSPALTVDDLEALGISGVDANNLHAVLAAIEASHSSGVNTLDKLADVVANGIAAYDSALSTVQNFADGGATVPRATDYQRLGLNSLAQDAPLIDSVNTVLASSEVIASDIDDAGDISDIANVYDQILTESAANPGNLALSASDYALLGLDVPDAATAELLNDVLQSKAAADVDEWDELAAFASTAARVTGLADGTDPSPALTAAELNNLGLTNTSVTDDNLEAVLAAIEAGTVADVDALSELDTVVSNAVSAFDTAIGNIQDYAGDSSK